VTLRATEFWSQLGTAALELLDVEMAVAGEGTNMHDTPHGRAQAGPELCFRRAEHKT
jgi:hypothetical protein